MHLAYTVRWKVLHLRNRAEPIHPFPRRLNTMRGRRIAAVFFRYLLQLDYEFAPDTGANPDIAHKLTPAASAPVAAHSHAALRGGGLIHGTMPALRQCRVGRDND